MKSFPGAGHPYPPTYPVARSFDEGQLQAIGKDLLVFVQAVGVCVPDRSLFSQLKLHKSSIRQEPFKKKLPSNVRDSMRGI